MTRLRSSVRLRLTLWYAAVLLCILAILSAGVYAFVRSRLERSLGEQLDRDFGTVATVVAASPQGWGSGGHIPGDVLFMVMDGTRVLYHSEAWCRARFMSDVFAEPAGSTGVWRSRQGMPHRLKVRTLTINGRELKATVAEDTASVDYTLRSLLRVLLLAIPAALGLAVTGGYFVAGRSLAPLRAMVSKSREITADALDERLPVENPNDELGGMATVFNETLARLHASFERLRNFTGNVSHELRTPLTAIRSVGEVALQRPLDAASLRDVIGSMLEEVDRLTRVVDCLLDLARTEAGAQVAAGRPARVDLAAEAEDALELVRVLADEKGQTLSVDVRRPAVVRGDAALLHQALLNLLDNAIRYTPPAGRIGLSTRHRSDGRVVIEVEDNGPGIEPGDRDRIFERFYRAPARRPGPGRGAGLGLAIARAAVESANGRLEYHDVPGGGSCFRVILPAGDDPPESL